MHQDIIRRGETIVEDDGGPIIVCTRNDDLDGVLEATPPQRRKGKLFLQFYELGAWVQIAKGIFEF